MTTITHMDLILLKEKIAVYSELTPAERDLILNCLNLGDYRSIRREYPKNFGPGSSMWATGAWGILDQMKPDALTLSDRFMLGGMIAGALKGAFEMGKHIRHG